MPDFDVLGLDIGGANLKAAHSDGTARSRPFALWKAPDRLADALRDLLRGWPPFDRLAVTMTGELCDCFASKREGVLAILAAVRVAAGPTPVAVWRNDGRLVSLDAARADPLPAAAANWLALATWAGRLAPHRHALLIDVGSTTTDIVPLIDGRPVPGGRTDTERLRCGELTYTGVIRTPLCACSAPTVPRSSLPPRATLTCCLTGSPRTPPTATPPMDGQQRGLVPGARRPDDMCRPGNLDR